MNVDHIVHRIPELNKKFGLRLRRPHIEGVYRVYTLLSEQIAEHHHLSRLVKVARINDHDLKKMFKVVFGINMYKFLMHQRIEYAKKQLTITNKKVSDIAEECGYSNPEYFTIFFKKETGMTPSNYRKFCSHN